MRCSPQQVTLFAQLILHSSHIGAQQKRGYTTSNRIETTVTIDVCKFNRISGIFYFIPLADVASRSHLNSVLELGFLDDYFVENIILFGL